MDLVEKAACAGGNSGVVWTLGESSDLNANLVRFGAGPLCPVTRATVNVESTRGFPNSVFEA